MVAVVLSLKVRNSPSVGGVLEDHPPGVVSNVFLSTLSMIQLKRSGDRTHPCLTPPSTWNSSDVPSAVLTWHQVLVYISWVMSV